MLPDRVAVVIPARDEAATVADTVRAVWTVPAVDLVVVVDDGSRDTTALQAARAGALVVGPAEPSGFVAGRGTRAAATGKGAALSAGAALVAARERGNGQAPRALLFVDADLGGSASATAALVGPVLAGDADVTIAVLAPQRRPGGGRGLVVGLARRGIAAATGYTPTQPLSGMRCLTRGAYERASPLARGWGVETAMTIDLVLAGLRLTEVPCELHHRVTGTDRAAQLHRARQFRDVARALAVRRWRSFRA